MLVAWKVIQKAQVHAKNGTLVLSLPCSRFPIQAQGMSSNMIWTKGYLNATHIYHYERMMLDQIKISWKAQYIMGHAKAVLRLEWETHWWLIIFLICIHPMKMLEFLRKTCMCSKTYMVHLSKHRVTVHQVVSCGVTFQILILVSAEIIQRMDYGNWIGVKNLRNQSIWKS